MFSQAPNSSRLSPLILAAEALLLFAFSCAFFSALWPEVNFLIFTGRDHIRAEALWQGKMFFWGSEVSGGGNTPGNFLYVLLGLPTLLGAGFGGTWALCVALLSGAIALSWVYLRARFSPLAAFAALAIPFLSCGYMRMPAFFCNPSFLPFFLVSAAVLFVESGLAASQSRRNLCWIVAHLVLGLALQLHYTALILALAANILFFVFYRRAKRRPTDSALITGGLVFAITLLPHLLAKAGILGLPTTEVSGNLRYINTYSLRMNIFYLSYALDPMRMGDWTGSFSFFREVYALGFASLFYFLFRRGFLAAPAEGRPRLPWTANLVIGACVASLAFAFHFFWLRASLVGYGHYAFAALLLLPLAFGFFFFRFGTWALLGLYLFWCSVQLVADGAYFRRPGFGWSWLELCLFALFISSFAFTSEIRSRGRMLIAAFAIWIFVLAVSFRTTYRHDFDLRSQAYFLTKNAQPLTEYFSRKYGYSTQELSKRVFFFGIKDEIDFSFFYERARPRELPPITREAASTGFLVTDTREMGEKLFQSMNNGLPLANLIKANAIQRLPVEEVGGYFVFPYRWRDPAARYFVQTMGEPYWDKGVGAPLLNPLDPAKFTRTLSVYSCPGERKSCEVHFSYRVDGDYLDVRLDGPSLSQPSQVIFPDWTEVLWRPYLRVQCGKRRVETLILSTTVGYLKDNRTEPRPLAPFVRRFPMQCRSGLQVIGFGWGSSQVYSNFFEGKFRPGQYFHAANLSAAK